ncbi:MAG TPA: DUF2007 domain-containing protein [Gammaproteobacteria bacterium]
MKLVYQTSEMERANEILGVLKKAGIESSLHGVHTWSIRHPSIRNPLSVWILHDADASRAGDVLERFFAGESPRLTPAPIRPARTRVRLAWLLLALGTGVLAAIVVSGA